MSRREKILNLVQRWKDSDPDPATVAETEALLKANDIDALERGFGGRLAFGTAGLRGLLGAGPRRMNRAVVRQTTWGLCQHLASTLFDARERGVVIGRDARRGSEEFANEAAGVCAALGFKVHWISELSPTPLCAFAVTQLKAAGGIMITASHNPPEYNGYKVYWENGAQIVPPHDTQIAAAIDNSPDAGSIDSMSLNEAEERNLLIRVPEQLIRSYLDALSALDFGLPADRELKISYTPLHGVGLDLTRRIFSEAGFSHFSVVPSQEHPDGAFPTVRFPNPEEPGAMDAVLEHAELHGSDLVIAHDPDADRLCAGFRRRDGKMQLLSGNEIGVLLGHHRVSDDPSPSEAAEKRLLISTLVSTPQLGHIAESLKVRYAETLTGFKWIANQAMELEEKEELQFIFGFEEALGSTVSTVVRDKDGIGAALVFALLAAQLRAKGQTIGDRLDEIARKFGVYASSQHSQVLSQESISRWMDQLRSSPPSTVAGLEVLGIRDLLQQKRRWSDGREEPVPLPKSNVLVFDLSDGCRIIARPSGTEPKIKFYFDLRIEAGASEALDSARTRAREKLKALETDFLDQLQRE